MSGEERRVDREGIHIDRELAEEVAIEEELDSNVVGVYRFPDPGRRRISGWLMAGFGVISLLAVPHGWPVALGFGMLAGWCFLSAWPLAIDEHQALRTAGSAVGFPVGHASATVRFKGWRSRPRWSVVLYSASEPPDQRALVVIDAVSGEVVETPYVEDVAPV
jgi:hypothetical protein